MTLHSISTWLMWCLRNQGSWDFFVTLSSQCLSSLVRHQELSKLQFWVSSPKCLSVDETELFLIFLLVICIFIDKCTYQEAKKLEVACRYSITNRHFPHLKPRVLIVILKKWYPSKSLNNQKSHRLDHLFLHICNLNNRNNFSGIRYKYSGMVAWPKLV